MGKLATDESLQSLKSIINQFLNSQQSTLASAIGTLSSLKTSAKGSTVGAINELVTQLSTHTTSITNLTTALNTLSARIEKFEALGLFLDADGDIAQK